MTAPVKHIWAALLVVYVVWGSTYFGIKIAVETVPPLLAGGVDSSRPERFSPRSSRSAGRACASTGGSWERARSQGGLLLGLGVGLVHVAETADRLERGGDDRRNGSAADHRHAACSRRESCASDALSTLAGLVGLGLVVAPGLGAGSTALGLAVMVSATMFWSTGSFLSRRLALPRNPFVATAYEMAFGGAFLTIASVAFGEWVELGSATFALDSVTAWVYLVVMGSLVGFTAYAWLLRVAPISLVVTHQYVNPLVAIALGMVFLGERPSPWSLAGALIVMGAVYVAIRAEFSAARPRAPRGLSESPARRPGASSASPQSSGEPRSKRRRRPRPQRAHWRGESRRATEDGVETDRQALDRCVELDDIDRRRQRVGTIGTHATSPADPA